MENTYVLYDDSGECVIMDPGCYEQPERDVLRGFIEKKGLKPVRLVNTHCHIDHILGNKFVAEYYGLGLEIHKLDHMLLMAAPQIGSSYGIAVQPSVEPSAYLEEGSPFEFGNTSLEILHTPGHSPGSISFYCRDKAFVIVGDVLFLNSIGRYDFPNSNLDHLLESIKTKLFRLDDQTTVYAGHGPKTTIGHEKRTNPFVGVNAAPLM